MSQISYRDPPVPVLPLKHYRHSKWSWHILLWCPINAKAAFCTIRGELVRTLASLFATDSQVELHGWSVLLCHSICIFPWKLRLDRRIRNRVTREGKTLTCRSFIGFQSCSRKMTVSAEVRFRPRPPTLVVRSITEMLLSSLKRCTIGNLFAASTLHDKQSSVEMEDKWPISLWEACHVNAVPYWL